ncbi:hypothetical protein HPB49_010056 [Dermacentor silvarum]|uniref:Uncharacterized protein n=1 Tax=Dermacentor silvarum TaxID=543639 RepID=A0ACB8DCE3_DERSI|nr:hypothetical protein HPB49_010056 [Dermacentor silvarum]
MFKWFLDAGGKNISISGTLLIQKVSDLAFFLSYPVFRPGNRWLQRFKEHRGIIYQAIVGEAAAVNEYMANDWLSDHIDEVFVFSKLEIYTFNFQRL